MFFVCVFPTENGVLVFIFVVFIFVLVPMFDDCFSGQQKRIPVRRPAVCTLAETLGMGDGEGEVPNAAGHPPSSLQALGQAPWQPSKTGVFFHALRTLEVRDVR